MHGTSCALASKKAVRVILVLLLYRTVLFLENLCDLILKSRTGSPLQLTIPRNPVKPFTFLDHCIDGFYEFGLASIHLPNL